MKKRNLIVTGIIVGCLLIGSTAVFASTSDGVASFLERFTNITEHKVENGELTQAQADDIKSWLEDAPEGIEDVFHGGMRQGSMHGRENGPVQQYAELKGVDVEEVMTILKESELSIFELAEQDGLFDELKATMLEERKEMMASAVEAGRLTQEEADTHLTEMTEAFANWTDASVMPEGHGMGGKPSMDGERPDSQFGGKGPRGFDQQNKPTNEA